MSKWIPVEERLPPHNSWVLVCKRNLKNELPLVGIDRCTFTVGDDRMWLNDYMNWKQIVTHWMPLPPPPEMKGEKT